VYPVNAARLLASEPTEITAQKVVGPTGVDVNFVATLKFASGVLAHIDSGFSTPERSRLEVVGSHGTLTVNNSWHCRTPGPDPANRRSTDPYLPRRQRKPLPAPT